MRVVVIGATGAIGREVVKSLSERHDVIRCARTTADVVRERSGRDDHRTYITAALEDGTRILVDRRAAERLPSRFALTVRWLGPRKHLDLDLAGEQWGALLYD